MVRLSGCLCPRRLDLHTITTHPPLQGTKTLKMTSITRRKLHPSLPAAETPPRPPKQHPSAATALMVLSPPLLHLPKQPLSKTKLALWAVTSSTAKPPTYPLTLSPTGVECHPATERSP